MIKLFENADPEEFIDIGNVRIYGGRFLNSKTDKYEIVSPENLITWLKSHQGTSCKFIIVGKAGKVIIGSFVTHSHIPGYSMDDRVIHGFIYPWKKQIYISNIYGIPQIEYFKNEYKVTKNGIENMEMSNVIDQTWTIKPNMGNPISIFDLKNSQEKSDIEAKKSSEIMTRDREHKDQYPMRQILYRKSKLPDTKGDHWSLPRESVVLSFFEWIKNLSR